MTSLSPVRYIQILSRLNLRDGKYWIKAHDNALSAQGCLTYDSLKRSLSQSNCSRALYSVCSRSVFGNNDTDILENAVFKQMLKDMTLDRTNTAVSRRHRMSINNDHRWSVRATGVIGLLIIGVVMGLMVLSDLTKLSGCQCYRLCKCCKRISRTSKDKNLKMLNKNPQTSSQC
ncbi:uncharacterized protein LOC132726911 [Ruditapes philippinarum]|uniref:uncharacterized protein LOC132726911 n=1 Tax=Ruditapes philippinarum TaxID=129788 RepID=UPI00295B1F73|nr:uncharacterized protein LOC132726911 [Ruditapes philippinarum]